MEERHWEEVRRWDGRNQSQGGAHPMRMGCGGAGRDLSGGGARALGTARKSTGGDDEEAHTR